MKQAIITDLRPVTAEATVGMSVYHLLHHAQLISDLLDAQPHLVLKEQNFLAEAFRILADVNSSLTLGRRVRTA